MSSCSRISRAIRWPVAPRPRTSTTSRSRVVGEDARRGRRSARRARRGRASRGSARAARRARRPSRRAAPRRGRPPGGGSASSDAVSSAFGLVDSTRVTARSTIRSSIRSLALAEVEDRRLGDRADDLVGRGEDDVGAALERRGRQRRGEVQVRAPGLVDDQRHVARVRDLGERGDVGDGAEVGRRDDDRRDRVGLRVERRRRATPASGSGRSRARGRARGRRTRGRRPERTSPSMIDEWTLRWTTTRSPRWASARQIAWLPPEPPLTRNQLRRAPQASAASRCASWNGVVGGIGADVDALDPGRDVEPQRRSPIASRSAGSAPGPALVAGDVEAARVAIGVGDQRVEVGSRVLVHARHVSPTATVREIAPPPPRPGSAPGPCYLLRGPRGRPPPKYAAAIRPPEQQ